MYRISAISKKKSNRTHWQDLVNGKIGKAVNIKVGESCQIVYYLDDNDESMPYALYTSIVKNFVENDDGYVIETLNTYYIFKEIE